MKILIRLMKKSDLVHLSKIYVEVYDKFDVGEKWTQKRAYELLLHWLKIQPDLAFVAEVENKVVGAFVTSIQPWWDGNHIFGGEIFVHPKFQKMGIGKQLSRTLFEKAAKNYNVKTWDAFTFKNEEFPLKWYKSLGFEEINNWTMISGNIKEALRKMNIKSDV